MSKLPTANEIINENLGGLELTMDDDMWKFYKDVIRQCIESHTAAHTAGLEAKYNEAYSSAAKYAEESVRLRERVKELEEKNRVDGSRWAKDRIEQDKKHEAAMMDACGQIVGLEEKVKELEEAIEYLYLCFKRDGVVTSDFDKAKKAMRKEALTS